MGGPSTLPSQNQTTQNKAQASNKGGFDLLDLSAGGINLGHGAQQNKAAAVSQGLGGDFDLMSGLSLSKPTEKQDQRKKSPNELFDFGL